MGPFPLPFNQFANLPFDSNATDSVLLEARKEPIKCTFLLHHPQNRRSVQLSSFIWDLCIWWRHQRERVTANIISFQSIPEAAQEENGWMESDAVKHKKSIHGNLFLLRCTSSSTFPFTTTSGSDSTKLLPPTALLLATQFSD